MKCNIRTSSSHIRTREVEARCIHFMGEINATNSNATMVSRPLPSQNLCNANSPHLCAKTLLPYPTDPYARKCPTKTNPIAMNATAETPAACPAIDAFVAEAEALADPVPVAVFEVLLVTWPAPAEVVEAGTEAVAVAVFVVAASVGVEVNETAVRFASVPLKQANMVSLVTPAASWKQDNHWV